MKIAFLGDILLDGRFNINQNKELKSYFKEVSELLSHYDYVVGNLETPFVSNQKPHSSKSAHIKADVENIEVLKFLNINIVTLANNHIYDFGKTSFELTKNLLTEAGIKYFGVEDQQVLIQKDQTKIALHGYCCYSTNPFGLDKEVNALEIKSVEKRMKHNDADGFFNVLGVHCGQEHIHAPNYDHVLMARRFSKICPYVFYGHHPHVIQSIEEINDSLIAYSLGNFCIDKVYTKKSIHPIFIPSEYNLRTYILEIEFDKNVIKNYRTIPIYIGEDSMLIGSEKIQNDIDSYRSLLEKEPTQYSIDRQMQINQYITSRMQLRDVNWYLKRLNFGSVRQILATRRNLKMYKRCITSQLNAE